MRLLLVATELPVPTRGGSLCLHRLLHGGTEATVEILTHEREEIAWPWPVHRVRRGALFYKFWHSRFGTRLQNSNRLHGWELPLGPARRVLANFRPDFILTVAYGPALVSARRLSESSGVPLATLFMDWWPDLACHHLDAPRAQHAALEREFTRVHHASRVSFHFSPEMQRELGPRPGDTVLYPAVGAGTLAPAPADAHVLAYAGLATGLYAASITAVARSSGRRPADRLELFNPGLPPALLNDLPLGVSDRGFVPAAQLPVSLQSAGALLVVLPFDADDGRLARTSFSSKFAEYCRFGRPIIIWGPPDAAIVQFARATGSALTVTEPQAEAVWSAFHRLQEHPSISSELVDGALRAYATHFDPAVVRAHFHRTLASALT